MANAPTCLYYFLGGRSLGGGEPPGEQQHEGYIFFILLEGIVMKNFIGLAILFAVVGLLVFGIGFFDYFGVFKHKVRSEDMIMDMKDSGIQVRFANKTINFSKVTFESWSLAIVEARNGVAEYSGYLSGKINSAKDYELTEFSGDFRLRYEKLKEGWKLVSIIVEKEYDTTVNSGLSVYTSYGYEYEEIDQLMMLIGAILVACAIVTATRIHKKR